MSSTPGIMPVKMEYYFALDNATFDIAYILQNKVITSPTTEGDGIHIEGTDYEIYI